MKLFYILLGIGLGIEAGLLSLIIAGDLTEQSGIYVGVFAALFGLFILASYLIFKSKPSLKPAPELVEIPEKAPPAATASPPTKSARSAILVLIIFFAALFRLTMVFAAPTLSTDQFRYTWEGHLVTLGISPYRYAPNDPALVPYHSEIWPLVQQKESTSPYPPLSQVVGAVEYTLLGDSLFGPKIAAALFDFLTCLVLLWLLGIFKLDPKRIILYAWCPLPIIEFGLSGHNDALMLLLMLVAVGLALQQRPALSAITLGLACLAKFTPLFGLPLFLVAWEGRSYLAQAKTKGPAEWSWRIMLQPRYWRYPALTLGVVVAGYLPFLLVGEGAIGSILEYTGTWRDNEGFIYQIANQLGGIYTAKFVSLAILAATVAILAFHPRLALEWSLPRRLMLVLGVTLLVASTVHSWYVSWVLLWLPLGWGKDFKGWDRAWLLFAVLLQVPYLDYSHAPDFWLRPWIRPLEYVPLHLLIGWDILCWWKAKRVSKHQIILKKELSDYGDY